MEAYKMFSKRIYKNKPVTLFTILILAGLFVVFSSENIFADGSISQYSAVPSFLSQGVPPNVLIILDNSNSMDEDVNGNAVGSDAPNSRSEIARQAILALIHANSSKMRIGLMAYDQSGVQRYEIHNAAYYCSYDPSTYDPNGTPTPKDPSTNTLRYPNPSDPGHYIYFDVALPFYDSSSQGTAFLYSYNFTEDGSSNNDQYWAYSDKTGLLDPHSGATKGDLTGTYGYANYNDSYTFGPTDDDIAAGFHEFGEQMFWVHVGPTWFSNSSPGGGYLHVPIDDSTAAGHITALEQKLGTSNFSTTTSDHPNNDLDTPVRNAGLTPIAGTLNSAMKYFQGTLPTNQGGPKPSPVQYECQKNFIVLVTDGLPSVDKNGNTGNADSLLPEVETEVSTLRSTTISGFPDHPFDIQTFVLGFALPAQLGSKLDDIAVAGGTDVDGHAYLAGNATELARTLQNIFLEILNRVSSGSAASVISNSRSGEGAIYQSIFFPEFRGQSGHSVNWSGDVHALLVDQYGNMREDTNGNHALDLDTDKIVEYNGDTGKAELYNFNVATQAKTFDSEVEITQLHYLWDASSWLKDPSMDVLTQREYDSNEHQRYIFTDKINTDLSVSMSNVDNTQTMDFTSDFADDPTNDNYFFLNPYLTYDDDNNPSTPEVPLTETQMITEAQNIIKFIRGKEGLSETGSGTPYRNRTIDTDGDGVSDTTLRLGDFIHSTPTVVSQPAENYDLIYKDSSYQAFKKKYLYRRSVVYAGANDGMLHAFNGGFYDVDSHQFNTRPLKWDSATSSWIPDTTYTDYDLGSELWAYIPNALLPHLRWLKEQINETTHVYYVDLKPLVFDARIFFQPDGVTPIDSDHPNGWGTILVGGMRLGGAPISVDTNGKGTANLNFRSSYFALDITNPEEAPKLLWSFNDDNLGFTTVYPTPIRVGDKWYVVIGSGPVDYEATRKDDGTTFTAYGGSNRTASVYVLNASDGSLKREFSMDSHSFMSDPIAVDFDLKTTKDAYNRKKWSGEAIYIASDGSDPGLEGRVFRIKTNDDEDPDNWTKAVFFNPNTGTSDHQHINTALSVANDDEGRIWVYFGTGRFWSSLDRTSPYLSYQNAFYGIKEPVDTSNTMTYAPVGAKDSTLRNVTGIQVQNYNTISLDTSIDSSIIGSAVADQNGDDQVDYSDLMAEVRAKDGWYFNFTDNGERNLGQAAVLGDIVTFSTYVPNNDLCSYEGTSNLYGVYYKTGTAYWKGVLKTADNNFTGINDGIVVYKVDTGKGYSTTPNLHTGKQEGSKAFLQTSTGAIISIQQDNPGITKSGKVSWKEVSQ